MAAHLVTDLAYRPMANWAPPEQSTTVPVTYPLVAVNRIARATSSGRPTRPAGTQPAIPGVAATSVDRRPHTGRRRNQAARQAILDAALRLLRRADGDPVSVETIAREAGVGKQTIYRWWPSKGAVILEALTERARDVVPTPDTGSLRNDLEAFLTSTFRVVERESTASLLRTVMAEAQRDAHLSEVLGEFTSRRRAALREITARGRDRGDLPPDADLDLLVELAYGVLWYRVLIGHAPLTDRLASRLAHALVAAAHTPP